MKKLTYIKLFISLVLFIHIPLNAALQTSSQTEEFSYPVNQKFVLEVQNLIGDCKIEPSFGSNVEFFVTLHAMGKSKNEANELLHSLKLDTIHKDNTVQLKVVYPFIGDNAVLFYPKENKKGSWFSNIFQKQQINYLGKKITLTSNENDAKCGLWVDFVIKVPDNGEIMLENDIGGLTVHNTKGLITLKTKTAPIRAINHQGKLIVDSRSGNVGIDNCSGSFCIHAGSGLVEMRNCTADLDDMTQGFEIDSGSGDMKIEHCSGVFFLNSGSGRIDILSCDGDARIVTGSGNVRFLNFDGKDIGVQTGSGNVDIFGNLKRAQNVSVTTGSGNVNIHASSMSFAKYILSSRSGKAVLDVPCVQVRNVSKKHVDGTSLKNKTGKMTISSGSGNIAVRN